MAHPIVHLGDGPQRPTDSRVEGAYVTLSGETYYRIGHVDAMPPFLISLVSPSNHWFFVSEPWRMTTQAHRRGP